MQQRRGDVPSPARGESPLNTSKSLERAADVDGAKAVRGEKVGVRGVSGTANAGGAVQGGRKEAAGLDAFKEGKLCWRMRP